MIFIKRVETPSIFKQKQKQIDKEINKARDFYAGKITLRKSEELFRFYQTYKDGYKDLLIEMFHHRCAYCECLVTIGGRGDIEHFRPKGVYEKEDGTQGKPGYYWLAACWENLYLSCTNCNQKSTLRIIDPEDPANVIQKTVGKMNKFALLEETYRAKEDTWKDKVEEPYRMLLDPCSDNPADFLEFTSQGIVKPKSSDKRIEKIVNYSIDVYGLQREELVHIRERKYLEVMDLAVTINRLSAFVFDGFKNQLTTAQHRFNCEEMEKQVLKLMSLLDVNNKYSEYVGIARQYASPFLLTFFDQLKNFLLPNKNEPWFNAALAYFEKQLNALKGYFEPSTATT